MKKDYLNEGAMADTADLVVLGAFYGQGSKGKSLELASYRHLLAQELLCPRSPAAFSLLTGRGWQL